MNTKELIKFCVIELGEHPTKYYDKYFNRIISLLKRGEKYEAMWNELEIKLLKGYFINHNIKFENCKELYKELKDIIEQKYFPKGKN